MTSPDAKRLKVLVAIDTFTRECLALVADTSIGNLTPVEFARTVRVDDPNSPSLPGWRWY
jgi:hypothetical protein